jgi:Glycosyl transferase family 2
VVQRVNRSGLQVSVIVPAYNAARTLDQTLASARAQSTDAIEIIVINDGSTDATATIAAKVAMRDARVRVITQANTGVSAARNAGIEAARAPVVAFLDADDLWPAHHLAAHLERLAADPALDVSFSCARYIDETGLVVGASAPYLRNLDAATALRSNPTTTTSTWVARRSAFDRVGMFDTPLARCEDQAWLVRAGLAGLTLRGTDASIVDYRISHRGLASDLTGMRQGFVAMLDQLSVDHPAFVAAHRTTALASEDLYLARRALQLSLPLGVAGHYLSAAVRGAPLHLLATPRALAGIIFRILARPLQPVTP